MIMLQL